MKASRVGLLLVLALGAAACSPGEQTVSWLVVLDAPTATAAGDVLVLEDPGPRVTLFTDRPHRFAGLLALETFVDHWDAYGFADVPPNAAVVYSAGGGEQVFVVTITSVAVAEDGTLELSYRPVPEAPGDTAGRPC